MARVADRVLGRIDPLYTGDFEPPLTDVDALVISWVEGVHYEHFMPHGDQALAIVWPVYRLIEYWVSIDPNAVQAVLPLEGKLTQVLKLADLGHF